MTVSVKHLDELYFFSAFRALVLYFKHNLPFVESYSLVSPHLMKQYNSDRAYLLYDVAALEIKNLRQAILKITSFMVSNDNYHISNFAAKKKTSLEIYSKNKQKLLDDFKEELDDDVVKQLYSGRLYSKIASNKINIELYGYINTFYPIVKLARSYKTEDTYYNILKSINKKIEVDAETDVEKVSNVLKRYIETDDTFNEDMKQKISSMLSSKINTEKNRNSETSEITEDTDYDIFYC